LNSIDYEHKNYDKITLVIANFCSVYNKEAELDAFLSYNDIDILLGTASHLDTSIFNCERFPNIYNIYRMDRNRHGGGVFIMVKDNLPTYNHFRVVTRNCWG